jgi:hypothetical protein
MNPENKIKQILDEALVDSVPQLDRRILDNAWQAGQRGRQIQRRLLGVALIAVLCIVICVSVPTNTKQPGDEQEEAMPPWTDRWTLGAANIRHRQGGMKGLEQFSMLGQKRSGPRPEPLSIQRVLAELED